MDITTIVGLLAGYTLVIMGAGPKNLELFLDIPALLITGGGTISAFLIASPLQDVIPLFRGIGYAFYFPGKYYAKVHPEIFEKMSKKPEPATDEELERLRFDLTKGAESLRRMRPYPIGIGILGTLIGLVLIGANLDDVGALGRGLAISLITIFYGILFTYLLILPLSHKLEARLKSLDQTFFL